MDRSLDVRKALARVRTSRERFVLRPWLSAIGQFQTVGVVRPNCPKRPLSLVLSSGTTPKRNGPPSEPLAAFLSARDQLSLHPGAKPTPLVLEDQHASIANWISNGTVGATGRGGCRRKWQIHLTACAIDADGVCIVPRMHGLYQRPRRGVDDLKDWCAG